MSDSDDGFDEEAVREELREKYENEQEDREATARMSELLLQGATMTNDHCDRCGSPLFRQDGQTFCPNCQHAAQQQAADQAAGQQSQEQQSQGQRARDQQAQRQPQSQQPADPQTRSEGAEPQPQNKATRPDGQQQHSQDAATDAPARDSPAARDLPEHAPTATASGPAGDALESTIAALARRAASADDPRTAREYLEAAREAAEALAALR